MKCQKDTCPGRLMVSHTYAVGKVKHQRARCRLCGQVYALTTTAEPVDGRGEGARARAERAKQQIPCEPSSP